jgi:osmotically inducible protein OsmC
MGDLSFDVELRWSETEHKGVGEIQTDDLTLELSGPKSMGGRGVGTNPEELLVCAVSSCYTATLFSVLRHARLPVDSLAVGAQGTVTGFPGHTRFSRIGVSPTILGGDVGRRSEYEAAAVLAHDRCFIGRTLVPEVAYEVGSVEVLADAAFPPAAGRASVEEGERPAVERRVEDSTASRAA